ncbi:MAG TPA: DotU family type IV/VI secretion system protein [Thermoanaerobaculia bacterium]|jgi:hypothetical protein
MASSTDIPFLTREFRAFLRVLDRIERQIRALAAGSETAAALSADAAELPRDPQAIRDRLAAALGRHATDALRDGYDTRSPDFPQAQFLMARVADVTLDGIDWWGRGIAPPLAADFPRPPGVAEDVLQQIDDLLDAEPPSSALAEVYVLALAAGLEPAASPARREQLAAARRLLFDQVAHHRPDLLLPADPRIAPEAYSRQQPREPVGYLPDPRPWLAALLLVLAGLLVASRGAYEQATAPVRKALETMVDAGLIGR